MEHTNEQDAARARANALLAAHATGDKADDDAWPIVITAGDLRALAAATPPNPHPEQVKALIAWARDQMALPDGSGWLGGHIDENHRYKLRDLVGAIDARSASLAKRPADDGDTDRRTAPDFEGAWRALSEPLSWMHESQQLSRYWGWNLADIANDLIDQAYPGLRPGAPAPATPAQSVDAGEAKRLRLIARAIQTRMATACDWTKAGKDHVKVRAADWHVLMEIADHAKAALTATTPAAEGAGDR